MEILLYREWEIRIYVQNLALTFYGVSFLGWCWEVFYAFAGGGGFVNRGVLAGPWLPIYGVGGLLVLICLQAIKRRPWLCFPAACLLLGALEYGTGWLLETCFHLRYWDYSGCFGNLHGRVCLASLMAFGTGGMLFLYLLWPMLARRLFSIPDNIRQGLTILLTVLFLMDLVWSLSHPNHGAGIADQVSSSVGSCYGKLPEFVTEPLTIPRFLL